MQVCEKRRLLPIVFVLVFGVGIAGSAAQPTQPPDGRTRVLGGFPLCEASAVVWPGEDHLLVGDNEVRGSLFAFSLNDGRLDPRQSIEYSLGDGVEISDIEALVGLRSGEVVVFGSHGRNSRCRDRENRRRFLRGRPTADGFVASSAGVIAAREKISCNSLFGEISNNRPLLASVCERVDAVEQAADRIWDSDDSDDDKANACNEAQPFNAEGALAISDAGEERVWIGLRSPLLPSAAVGGGNDMAILLRLKSLDGYAFDEVALVDLGGAGIRDLTVSNGWILGIAGPPADSDVDFRLWMFPADQLEAGATITPTFIQSPRLPTSAEGLAVVESNVHVVIDGDQGDNLCIAPSEHLALPLPR